MRTVLTVGLLGLWAAQAAYADDGTSHQPAGLGPVQWLSSWDTAARLATTSNKPICLYVAADGDAGTPEFERVVLKNPILMDAIRDECIAVRLRNEASLPARLPGALGKQTPALILVNQSGERLTAGEARLPSPDECLFDLIDALKKTKRPVPEYLSFVDWGIRLEGKEARIILHGGCFCALTDLSGKLDGVLWATPFRGDNGIRKDAELTAVGFDPEIISFDDLVQKTRHNVVCLEEGQLDTAKRQWAGLSEKMRERVGAPALQPLLKLRFQELFGGRIEKEWWFPGTLAQIVKPHTKKYFSPSQIMLWNKIEQAESALSEIGMRLDKRKLPDSRSPQFTGRNRFRIGREKACLANMFKVSIELEKILADDLRKYAVPHPSDKIRARYNPDAEEPCTLSGSAPHASSDQD